MRPSAALSASSGSDTRTGSRSSSARIAARSSREGLIRKARYSPETITLTLDLYFSGLSLRKIARTLNDHFDMNLGKSSVYRWIETFVPMISEYANSLTPQLSETWHADEVFVKMRGGETAKGGMDRKTQKSMAYLWNVMDRKTRFLLASRLSQHRNVNGAVGAFNEARKVREGQPARENIRGRPQCLSPSHDLLGEREQARVGREDGSRQAPRE